MSTGRKLPLALTCVAILGLAFAVSCRGFFVNPTLTSISVNPAAPQVDAGKTLQLQAFGTYDDGSRKQIKSGVSWSSDTPNIATVDTNSGILTGVAPGTAGITASAEALDGTATATVVLTDITSLTVTPTSWSIGQNGGSKDFNAIANGNIDVSTGATWTVTPTPQAGSITCTNDGSPPETCTVDPNTTPLDHYTITVTYPHTNLAPTVSVTVTSSP
jgi:hypothetical protein